jgi:hypothetical protein
VEGLSGASKTRDDAPRIAILRGRRAAFDRAFEPGLVKLQYQLTDTSEGIG